MRFEKTVGRSFSPDQIKRRREELELLTGRPKRNTVINNDDITNLRIALYTTGDVLDFIERI